MPTTEQQRSIQEQQEVPSDFGAAIEGNSAGAPFNDLLVITSTNRSHNLYRSDRSNQCSRRINRQLISRKCSHNLYNTIGDTGNAGVVGFSIGNTTTTDLNFNGATYSFDGTTTITAASGDTIDIGAEQQHSRQQLTISLLLQVILNLPMVVI